MNAAVNPLLGRGTVRVTVYANDTTGRQLSEWHGPIEEVGRRVGNAMLAWAEKAQDVRVIVAWWAP